MKSVVAVSLLVACNTFQVSMAAKDYDLPHIEGYVPIIPGSDLATHKVALWRQKPDSYTENSYKSPKTGLQSFNSCMDKDVSAQNVCNSHGICAPFDRKNIVSPMFFCKCDLGWAGSECTVVQKSQTTAWLLSMFIGFTGVDEFYLGHMFEFAMKMFGLFVGCLLTAMGFNHGGLLIILSYWFYDIARIGSGPVHAKHAKVAADLPHWAFACFTLLFFAFMGFAMGVCKIYWRVKEKRRKADIETNYCACDSTGYPLDVKMMKPYDHYHVFGFPAPKPFDHRNATSLPQHMPPEGCI